MSPGEEVVLLVEDDPTLLDAYRLVLGSSGFRVATAGTAREAVRTLRQESVDWVVCDLGLPDVSGADVVRELRDGAAASDGPAPVILVLTGEDDTRLRRACRRAGAGRYLVKPVSGAELAEILRSAPG
jgi:two-component system KDP operon response regulator KdpE